MRHASTKGFSLVEMSIALIIVGLLTSAIFGGMKLVSYAKIRALNAAKDARQSEIYGFFSKYGEYPGDFSEATTYWNLPSVTAGDGDGAVAFKNADGAYEGYNAWQHLSLAKMTDRDYAGAIGGLATPIPETHVPTSVFGGGFFMANGYGGHDDANTLAIGAPKSMTDALSLNGLLAPKDARDADKKYDDGNPSQGIMHAIDGADVSGGDCVTTGDYNLSVDARTCVLAYKIMSQ
ncbi:MAG: type II secretion system protein [Rickettsiales bacterium]